MTGHFRHGGVDLDPRRRGEPPARRAEARVRLRGRRGITVMVAAAGALAAAVIAGGYYLYDTFFGTADYAGDGRGTVIVEVSDGASTTQIGQVLAREDVVASTEAFIRAAADEPRIRSIQPGFYQMRAQMSGESAVERMLDPATRVGQLEIRGGVQLDDVVAGDGAVAPGVLTLVSRATCTTVDGQERCVSPDELRTAMATVDPAELGVPAWALEQVRKAEPNRRLEGLLAPGRYNVRPDASAVEVLRELLEVSTERIEASGLVSGAQAIGADPYEVLVIASLVEKEGITPDMPRVARVIYNRLGVGQRLELDSTVNYPLDRQALRTTAEDRRRVGPYNSYAVPGLPPTPIAAAGRDAIAAALAPAEGPWLYFVRCQRDGSSCFAASHPEHEENVRVALANGAF